MEYDKEYVDEMTEIFLKTPPLRAAFGLENSSEEEIRAALIKSCRSETTASAEPDLGKVTI